MGAKYTFIAIPSFGLAFAGTLIIVILVCTVLWVVDAYKAYRRKLAIKLARAEIMKREKNVGAVSNHRSKGNPRDRRGRYSDRLGSHRLRAARKGRRKVSVGAKG